MCSKSLVEGGVIITSDDCDGFRHAQVVTYLTIVLCIMLFVTPNRAKPAQANTKPTRSKHESNTKPTRSQHRANTEPTQANMKPTQASTSQHEANMKPTQSQHKANVVGLHWLVLVRLHPSRTLKGQADTSLCKPMSANASQCKPMQANGKPTVLA